MSEEAPARAGTVVATRARDIMTSPVVSVPVGTTTGQIAETLHRHRISAVPVVDGSGSVVGLVSEFDLLSRAGALAEDVMTTAVVSVTPETGVDDVRHLLVDRKFRRVPVLDGGELVGIVSRGDVVALMATEWVCEVCGESVRSATPPEHCPKCNATGRFALQEQLPGT
jgi:CBS domain-containing protein